MSEQPDNMTPADEQALLLLDLMLAGEMDEARLMFDALPDRDYYLLASRALRLAAVTLRLAFGDAAREQVVPMMRGAFHG